MAFYLKEFETQAAYEAAQSGLILPNVSVTLDNNVVHYNPYVETRVVAKFNVTDTSNPTRIASATTNFSSIEIDGVEQSSVTTGYTFGTTGEHTVKYTLTDPTSIGNIAFWNCRSLTSIDIPDGVTSIATAAFRGCSGLTSIDIPDSVTSIGSYAFRECSSLTSIVIPSGVTSIGESAFNSCSGLTTVNIPSGVTSIGVEAFMYCSSLTSIDIPDSVTSIGNDAFDYCTSLTSCTIGSGVTSIGNLAFMYCSGLTSMVIPNSVTNIGNQAFWGCASLTSIISNATTAPTIQSNSFYGVKTGGTLTVPIGSTGYDVWMGTSDYYLGKYNWTKVEQ